MDHFCWRRSQVRIGLHYFHIKGEPNEEILKAAVYYSQCCFRLLHTVHDQAKERPWLILARSIVFELKNPIATLLIGLEYLTGREADGDERKSRILRGMQAAVNRAQDIVCRPTPYDLSPEKLNTVVRDVAELVQPVADDRGFDLELDLCDKLPSVAIGTSKLKERVKDLVRYYSLNTPTQGLEGASRRTLKVSTKIEVVGDHVPPGTRHPDWPEFNPGEKVAVVRIEGDGGGGSGNALERAIDPFFENWTTSGSIVQQHQGLVTINGVPESGVVVKIMLPAAKPDEP